MNGVRFGSLHSFTEWGLILSGKEIGSPEIKEHKVDIEGADGELDYTEAFGGVKFGNRTLKFEFQKGDINTHDFLVLLSDIHSSLFGVRTTVSIDDDSEWYYQGRCRISDFTQNGRIAKLSVEVDAEIVLTNSRMTVVPTITTDAEMKFSFKGNTYTAGAGTFRIPEIQLEQGQNTITVTGTGNVIFEYREGSL